jgi:hypothetical protein
MLIFKVLTQLDGKTGHELDIKMLNQTFLADNTIGLADRLLYKS